MNENKALNKTDVMPRLFFWRFVSVATKNKPKH